jgi:hypothetical protein
MPVRLPTAILMLVATLIAASPSHAGIRDLAKSAKEKAAKATGQKSADQPCTGLDARFDDTTVELTGDVLDKLLAGRKAARPMSEELAKLLARRVAIQKEIDDLRDKNGEAISENENRRAEVRSCRTMALDGIRQRKFQTEMANTMANPRSAEKTLKLTAAFNDAQMKGDTAEVNRLQKEMWAAYEPTHTDSMEAERQCGGMPALHPAQARIDALNLPAVDEKIRDLETQAMKAQVDKSKLTKNQIAMAWERITMYVGKSKKGAKPCGFSATELSALSEREDALAAELQD